MALSSSSTETDAINQYYDNIEGWRDSDTQASSLIAAIEWLLLKHAARQLSNESSRLVLSNQFDNLHKELVRRVAAKSTAREPMFGRARVENLG